MAKSNFIPISLYAEYYIEQQIRNFTELSDKFMGIEPYTSKLYKETAEKYKEELNSVRESGIWIRTDGSIIFK